MQALKIKIHGKVYQKGMLYFLKQEAFENNITGCISYNADHSIGVIAEGKKQSLDKFICACRNGIFDSLIENLNIMGIPLRGYSSFEVLDEIDDNIENIPTYNINQK